MNKQKDKKLFHYCTAETFKEILSHKTLRFSDVTKSNDEKEVKLLWDKYLEVIKKYNLHDNVINFINYEKHNQLQHTTFLTLSLSTEQDSVEMWKKYANDGVTLEINVNKMLAILRRLIYINGDFYLFENANNELVAQANITYCSEKEIVNYIKNVCKNSKDIFEAFNKIFMSSPTIKEENWNKEKECRFIIPYFHSGVEQAFNIEDLKKEQLKLINDKNKYGKDSTWLDVPIEIDLIESITISPYSKFTKKEIEELLFNNGFNINKISISDSSI